MFLAIPASSDIHLEHWVHCARRVWCRGSRCGEKGGSRRELGSKEEGLERWVVRLLESPFLILFMEDIVVELSERERYLVHDSRKVPTRQMISINKLVAIGFQPDNRDSIDNLMNNKKQSRNFLLKQFQSAKPIH